MNYILITPVKNEDQSLTAVIESVANQTSLPRLWIIIDDGSTDKTSEIIQTFRHEYDWIISIRLPEHPRDIYQHYAYVCNAGFKTAIDFCEKNLISFDFVGLLDGDTVLEERYFEKIAQEFKKDSLLGIASGGIYYDIHGTLKWERTMEFPRGTGRVWLKKCFNETEGYSIEQSPDTISNIKAILRGYRIKQFKNIIAIQTRKTCSVEGFWRSYIKAGECAYYLYRRPIVVFLNLIYYSFSYPFYFGFAYLIGYLFAFIRQDTRMQDIEIKNYFQKQNLSEIFTILKIRKLHGYKRSLINGKCK